MANGYPRLTTQQYDALAQLMRAAGRRAESPSAAAARMVFVDGLTVADAARACKISYGAAYKAVERAEDAYRLVLQAAGVNPES